MVLLVAPGMIWYCISIRIRIPLLVYVFRAKGVAPSEAAAAFYVEQVCVCVCVWCSACIWPPPDKPAHSNANITDAACRLFVDSERDFRVEFLKLMRICCLVCTNLKP